MKKPLRKPTARVHEDAVTHELVTVVLDRVQTEFDLVTRFIDRRRVLLSNADAQRLAMKLAGWVIATLPHTDAKEMP